MFVSKAEYRVKTDFAERNRENIRAFLPTALERLAPGSRYSVAVSEDGLSFVHLFFHQTLDEIDMLAGIPAFHHFLSEVMAGCEAPPNMATFTLI